MVILGNFQALIRVIKEGKGGQKKKILSRVRDSYTGPSDCKADAQPLLQEIRGKFGPNFKRVIKIATLLSFGKFHSYNLT